ncbi:MAG: hypothetical protein IJU50_11315 [Lachnospiraceae bacterium]|nr:hypothetical protein [Lachnospiraceae bacterium]
MKGNQGKAETGMKPLVFALYFFCLLAFSILPLPVFALVRGQIDTTNRENRPLAAFPVFAETGVAGFPAGLDAFFTDHLPFKNQLAVLGGLIDYKVFKSSASGSVLVGKNGFLFYKGSQLNGEDPIADYRGMNLYTEEELAEITARFSQAKEFLNQKGIRFVVLLAPNKERMYAELMPAYYGLPAKESRYHQAFACLEAAGIETLSPVEAISAYKAAHPGEPLYFSYDTHWTRLGAYLAASQLDKALGFEMPPLEEVERAFGEPFAEDLAIQIGLPGILADEPIYNPYGYSPHQSEIQVNAEVTQMDGRAQAGNDSGVLLIGDSFSTLMFPYLACNFDRSKMIIYYDYNEEVLEETAPDVVVFEIVERYLGNLTRFSIQEGIPRQVQ